MKPGPAISILFAIPSRVILSSISHASWRGLDPISLAAAITPLA